MEKIHLDVAIGSPTNSRDALLLRALRELRESHYPYQIPVIDPNNRSFRLSTTHKDTHLALGKLDASYRLLLCNLFEETFQSTKDPEMMFSFEPEQISSKPRAMLVVRSEGMFGPRNVTFHLSPVN